MILISCITRNYLNKALSYLRSLSVINSCKKIVVCLDFGISDGIKNDFSDIDFRTLALPKSHSHNMIQHGAFLDAIPEIKQEIVVLSDVDMLVQRDFTKREINRFEKLEDYEIFIGPNDGFYDTLEKEAERFQAPMNDKFLNLGVRYRPCHNCGLMIGKMEVFNKLRSCYEANCKEFYSLVAHRSRCQYLINWCCYESNIDVLPLCQSVHSHGHFGPPKGTSFKDGKLYYHNQMVMFRHSI